MPRSFATIHENRTRNPPGAIVMRRPRLRISIGRMMVLIALLGVYLAAGVSTFSYYPRPKLNRFPVSEGNGRSITVQNEDCSVISYPLPFMHTFSEMEWAMNPLNPNSKPTIIRPARPTLLKIWTPVLAAIGVTIVVLAGRSARGWRRSSVVQSSWL